MVKARGAGEKRKVSVLMCKFWKTQAEVPHFEFLFFSIPSPTPAPSIASWVLCIHSLNTMRNHWIAREGVWRGELNCGEKGSWQPDYKGKSEGSEVV